MINKYIQYRGAVYRLVTAAKTVMYRGTSCRQALVQSPNDISKLISILIPKLRQYHSVWIPVYELVLSTFRTYDAIKHIDRELKFSQPDRRQELLASKALRETEMVELQAQIKKLDPKGITEGDIEDKMIAAGNEIGFILKNELSPMQDLLNRQIVNSRDKNKFTRMKNWVHFLSEYAPNVYSRKPDRPPARPDDSVADKIEQGLKYISKNWSRVEGYRAIEKEFQHGRFTIQNDYGFSSDEISGAFAILDTASDQIKKAGFGDILLYGTVRLTTQNELSKKTSRSLVGTYFIRGDYISLAVDSATTEYNVATLVHELGHRLWNKFLTPQQQNDYVKSSGWISKAEISEFKDALVVNNFELSKAAAYIEDPVVRNVLVKKWRSIYSNYGRNRYLPEDKRDFFLRQLQEYGVDRSPFGAMLDRLMNIQAIPLDQDTVAALAITPYGKTAPEENFCETLMYYCTGRSIPKPILDRFLAVTSEYMG